MPHLTTHDRKSLTFEQAEGYAPLPAQLDRKVLSRELRAKLWGFVHTQIYREYASILGATGRWYTILLHLHVNHYHRRIDKFEPRGIVDRVGNLFEKGEYYQVYGWIEAVLKHDFCPRDFREQVQTILEECRAPYRIDDGIIWPVASPEESETLQKAYAALGLRDLAGQERI
jgi:hypothetical protein